MFIFIILEYLLKTKYPLRKLFLFIMFPREMHKFRNSFQNFSLLHYFKKNSVKNDSYPFRNLK